MPNPTLQAVGNAVGRALHEFSGYSAQAASRANGVSFASQNAQGQFNQQSANIANGLGSNRILDQYGFNSAQAASANAFTEAMWDKSAAYNTEAWERAAAWNEAMMEKQMQFNSAEAQKNRDWQQKMMETSYQRAVADMEKAGINPILASGGVSVGTGGGSAASIGAPQMGGSSISPMGGQAASGGLLNGISASEGNFNGQMEYMSGMLGLLSAGMAGLSTAFQAFGEMGIGKQIMNSLTDWAKGKNIELPTSPKNVSGSGLWKGFAFRKENLQRAQDNWDRFWKAK